MGALEDMRNYESIHNAFALELNALQTQLAMLPSAYGLPNGGNYREHGKEITRRQTIQQQDLRDIRHALEMLRLRMQLAEVNLKAEQAMRTAHAASRENEQLKREKTQ